MSLPPVVAERKRGPGLLVRAVWFVLAGWWLTGIASAIAWFAMITIIGLPLGIYLVNHIPTYLTLRPRTKARYWVADGAGGWAVAEVSVRQVHWAIRFLWFLVVGWWASFLVMLVAWFLLALVLTLPLGLMLYNRVPFAASLYRY